MCLDAGVQQTLEELADIGVDCQELVLVGESIGYLLRGLLCHVHIDSPVIRQGWGTVVRIAHSITPGLCG